MKKLLFLPVIVAVATLTGCATIVCGPSQSVNFSSTPGNAVVSDNGVQIGKTPLSAKLQRNEEHAITLKLDGYQPYEVMIKKTFNGWYLGNIVFGGIIGLVIDPLTGAIYKLTPNQVSAELNSVQASSAKRNGDIYIAVSLQPNPDWERIGSMDAMQPAYRK